MANVGVTFDFAAESAKLRSEIDKVRKELSSINATAKGIKDAFKTVGTAIAGALSVGVITSWLSKVNQAAGQLDDLSQRLSASASGLQSLQIAAAQAGGSAEAMNNALARMSVSLGDALANRSKIASDALARLGLNARELSELKTDEAMRRISTALSEVGNSYDRAGIAQAIFGKGAKDLGEFFAVAPDQINEVEAALTKAGAALDDIDVAKLGAMNDDLALQGQIVENLGIKFLANLSPAVTVATESFAGLIQNIGGATEAGKGFGVVMTAAIKIVEAAVYGLGAIFEGLRSIVSGVLFVITSGVEKLISGMAGAAEALRLDIAVPLRNASEIASGMAESFDSISRSAQQNATTAAAAAIKAGTDVMRAGEIFDEASRRLEERAAAAASRATGAQGAFNEAGAGGAAEKDKFKVRDPAVLSKENLGRLDPFSDPLVLEQISINETMQAVTDAHNATMLGKIEQFEQSKIGMLLNSSDLQQQIEFNKNATLGDAMSTLVGMAIQQGGALGKAGKAIAIAQTIWSTGQAVMKAMAEVPWPANIAAAANVAAMGVAQLANIKRTNIGGSGSILGARGGSVGASAPSLSDNIQGATGTPLQQQSAVQIIVQGSLFAAQETVDWLTEQIGAAVMDRDVVFISGNSRQAMELRG
jgi:hypothetical protein